MRTSIYTLFLIFSLLSSNAFSVDRSGGWRLQEASSPYLRLHADNPVNWYSWGDEAFAAAEKQNKPLFISIGYFTCHWCHVMEEESFANPAIAKLLNEHFISIKIDREQRPDIDQVYMSYLMATSGRGGWPMSIFATPDGKPFLGGTYFPNATNKDSGQLGMDELVPRLGTLWRTEQQNLEELGSNAVEVLNARLESQKPPEAPAKQLPEQARDALAEHYDELSGGFSAAPKFPQPAQIMLMLASPKSEQRDMALHTLDEIAKGGIQDQLVGGFHRYSTDDQWRVPHFEKMLYDQAFLIRAYLRAYQLNNNEHYANIARRTLAFTFKHMRGNRGGYYSALDADSRESHDASSSSAEGARYTWALEQWKTALPDLATRKWGSSRYGVLVNGNAIADPLNEMSGKNTLFLAKSVRELADNFKVSPKAAADMLRLVDTALLKERNRRPAVPIDDKVIAAWNAFMITTLVDASQILNEPAYLNQAIETAQFIQARLIKNKNTVHRDTRLNIIGSRAYAIDYAALTEAFLRLHEATNKREWLDGARIITDQQVRLFWDKTNGGFYASESNPRLWVRSKSAVDSVTASPNAISIDNLIKLSRLTGRADYARKATRTAAWASQVLTHSPESMPYALLFWDDL